MENGMLLSGLPDFPPSFIYEDGSELRLCPLAKTRGKPLYCSADARFFSYTLRKNKTTKRFERVLRQVKPWKTTHAPSRKSGGWQNYLKVGAGGYYCHILMAWAWLGSQPIDKRGIKYQCHHLNGIPTENRVSNLIWLSHDDHRRFDAALKQGLILTRVDPAARMEYELTHHCEF